MWIKNDFDAVVWERTEGIKFYILHDDNSHLSEVRFEEDDELRYEPYTVGKHHVTVKGYFADGKYISSSIQTRDVPLAFVCHSSMTSKYHFDAIRLPMTTLTPEGMEKRDDQYVAYYNAEKGWTKNAAEATDFHQEPYLSQFLEDYKNAGFNVLFPVNHTVIYPWEHWEEHELKRMMDTAWYKYGIKTAVWDDLIFSMPRNEEPPYEEVRQKIRDSYFREDSYMYEYVHHPGFFGFLLADEPLAKGCKGYNGLDMVTTTAFTQKACQELMDEEGIKCEFIGSLLNYPYMFRGVEATRKAYWEYYLNLSGSDHLYLVAFSPTICDNPKFSALFLDQFETTFEMARRIADERSIPLWFCCTAFSQSNETGQTPLNDRCVYQNAYYALMYGVETIAYFNACHFSCGGFIDRAMFGFDGKPSEIYGWVKTANDNIKKLRRALEGYHYHSSNVELEEAYQLVKVLWTNGHGDYAHFYMNMHDTYSDAPALAFSHKGEKYLYCTKDGGLEEGIAESEKEFMLKSGELLIVFNRLDKVVQFYEGNPDGPDDPGAEEFYKKLIV